MRHRVMVVICFTLPLLFAFLPLPLRAQTSLPDHPQPQPSLPDAPSAPVSITRTSQAPSFRRCDSLPGSASTRHGLAKPLAETRRFSMYQPQLEAWEGDELRAYAALAVIEQD